MSEFVIEVREPGKAAVQVTLRPGSLEVGRETSGLRLDDGGVSRRHLVLKVDAAGLTVSDQGSANGTFLNGARIVSPSPLRLGDVLRLSGTEIAVVAAPVATPVAAVPAPAAPEPVAPEPVTLEPVAPALVAAALEPVAPALAPATPAPAAAAPEPVAPDVLAAPVAEVSAAAVPAAGQVVGDDRSTVAMGALRPARHDLTARETEAGVIRFRPGTAGADAVAGAVAGLRRARRRLAGFGSEGSGVRPDVYLVDPFPDPDRPSEMIASGTVVDDARAEIWMVVTPEAPPEPLERPLALLFGAALPAAKDLGFLLEGYGLFLAQSPDPTPDLRGLALPPVTEATGQLRSAMALSFVRFLAEKGGSTAVRRLLVESEPGRLDAAAQDVFGMHAGALEEAWRSGLAGPAPAVEGGRFLRLTRPLLRRHRRRCAEIVATMVLGLSFTVVFPFAFRRLLDSAIPSRDFSQVLAVLAVVTAAFVVTFLADLRRTYLSAYVGASVSRDLRDKMFARLQSLSIGWLSMHQEGDVTSRFYSDVTTLETGLSSTLAAGVSQMASIAVSCVILVVLNVWLGLVVLAGVPLVLFVYTKMSAGAEKRSLVVQERTGHLVSLSAENYGAQGVVKAFALEGRERERFARATGNLLSAQVRLELFGGLFGLSVNVIVTALRVIVLALGAWFVFYHGFSVGGLVAFLGVMSGVLGPITVLTEIARSLQASAGSLVRINELLEAEPDVADGDGALPLPSLAQEIRLDDVSFAYSAERKTLEHLSVRIPAQSQVAFVGPTGAGKSSVLRLVMRLYDPDEGAVRFDGQDVRTATLASVRGQLGVVFQETFLFDTTVRENIAIGLPNATDEQIEGAARAAELHDFIVTLPRGYDTLVGEKGSRLSGGQRQRLAIARALVRQPAVLLLDEATSALDPRTERLIADTLARVGQGRTTIAVTHRLTSITGYDRIFVVVDGTLAEQGTHDELVAAGGVYAGLWAEQIGGEPRREAWFDTSGSLAKVPLFAALDPDRMATVTAWLRPTELAAGDEVPEDGRLVLVRRGRPVVWAPGVGGQLARCAELSPGDVFGLSGLLEGDTGAVLRAEAAASILVLDGEAIAGLADRFVEVATALKGTAVGAAPSGGRRLSRMTLGSGAQLPTG